jgi:ankyrin repeat protein
MDSQLIAIRNLMIESCSIGDTDQFIANYESHPELHSVRPWLYTAASDGNIELVRYLLAKGLNANERSKYSSKMPALKAACSIGNPTIAGMLMASGACVDVDSIDDNALFSAIHARSLDCVKLLVDAGIDIHKVYDLGHRHKNALAFAEEEGCTDIAKFLREHGAVLPPAK